MDLLYCDFFNEYLRSVVYLGFVAHKAPLGAGKSGRIMEMTPGLLSLGDVTWFFKRLSLQEKKKSNYLNYCFVAACRPNGPVESV